MSTQPFDPAQYKDGQRREWDSVSEGWRKWWARIEEGFQNGSDRMVELAEIQPGHRVLDVATGIGEPAVTAARRVGPTGKVIGIDQAPNMLAIGRERVTSLGLENVEFQEMDAERIDFPESSFDAVLCRMGLMFLPDVSAALKRIRSVLTPGGRFVAVIPDLPPKVPMISVAMGVVQQTLQLPPPPPGVPNFFSLSAPGVMQQTFVDCGFSDVRSEPLTLDLEYASGEEYAEFLKDVVAAVTMLLAGQSAERQTEIWQAIADAARQYAIADGTIHMPNETVCLVGRR